VAVREEPCGETRRACTAGGAAIAGECGKRTGGGAITARFGCTTGGGAGAPGRAGGRFLSFIPGVW